MLAWLHESATDAVHDTTPPGRCGRVAFSTDNNRRAVMANVGKYEWCVVDSSGNLYVAYSESDAYMVQHTVGGTIYFEGRKYR